MPQASTRPRREAKDGTTILQPNGRLLRSWAMALLSVPAERLIAEAQRGNRAPAPLIMSASDILKWIAQATSPKQDPVFLRPDPRGRGIRSFHEAVADEDASPFALVFGDRSAVLVRIEVRSGGDKTAMTDLPLERVGLAACSLTAWVHGGLRAAG